MSSLNAKHVHHDNAARLYLEAIRWPRGPACPHCGAIGEHYALQGKAHRPGLWKCKDCRRQFSVTVGTANTRAATCLWRIIVKQLPGADTNLHSSIPTGTCGGRVVCVRC